MSMHLPTDRPACWRDTLPKIGECLAFVSPEQRQALNGRCCDGCARTPEAWTLAEAVTE